MACIYCNDDPKLSEMCYCRPIAVVKEGVMVDGLFIEGAAHYDGGVEMF